MNRTANIAILTLASALAWPAQAAIYRCADARGVMSFQDHPCTSSHPANAVAHPPAARSRPAKTPSLAEWSAKAEKESRARQAEAKVRALEQENKQTEAEFAVMMEEIDAKKKDAAEARAEVPPVWALDQQAAYAKQEYSNRIRENKAELKEAREELKEATP